MRFDERPGLLDYLANQPTSFGAVRGVQAPDLGHPEELHHDAGYYVTEFFIVIEKLGREIKDVELSPFHMLL